MPNNDVIISYIGNIGLGRLDTILSLAKAVDTINETHKTNWKIRIYSGNKLTEEETTKVAFHSCLRFMGSLTAEQVIQTIRASDVLLFVESFLPEMIEVTRFSFSTKIMEYLSSGKPIISIGPRDASSIATLEDVAISFTETSIDGDILYDAMTDEEGLRSVVNRQLQLFHTINDSFRKSIEQIGRK